MQSRLALHHNSGQAALLRIERLPTSRITPNALTNPVLWWTEAASKQTVSRRLAAAPLPDTVFDCQNRGLPWEALFKSIAAGGITAQSSCIFLTLFLLRKGPERFASVECKGHYSFQQTQATVPLFPNFRVSDTQSELLDISCVRHPGTASCADLGQPAAAPCCRTNHCLALRA